MRILKKSNQNLLEILSNSNPKSAKYQEKVVLILNKGTINPKMQ